MEKAKRTKFWINQSHLCKYQTLEVPGGKDSNVNQTWKKKKKGIFKLELTEKMMIANICFVNINI